MKKVLLVVAVSMLGGAFVGIAAFTAGMGIGMQRSEELTDKECIERVDQIKREQNEEWAGAI